MFSPEPSIILRGPHQIPVPCDGFSLVFPGECISGPNAVLEYHLAPAVLQVLWPCIAYVQFFMDYCFRRCPDVEESTGDDGKTAEKVAAGDYYGAFTAFQGEDLVFQRKKTEGLSGVQLAVAAAATQNDRFGERDYEGQEKDAPDTENQHGKAGGYHCHVGGFWGTVGLDD